MSLTSSIKRSAASFQKFFKHCTCLALINVSSFFLGCTSSHTNRAGSSTTTNETTDDERPETREIEEQEYDQLVSHSSSTSENDGNLTKSASDDVPMETESSQSDAQAASACSTNSNHRTKHDDAWDESENASEASRANIGSKQESMMENLQDRLTTMRDGFLER